jgi:hypothetical protein
MMDEAFSPGYTFEELRLIEFDVTPLARPLITKVVSTIMGGNFAPKLRNYQRSLT